ncbi:MAG: thioredoxin family protein [Burkholderiaceae bacterium]|nr:thioredoxin family protein [Burkholderiaceae bacterium]
MRRLLFALALLLSTTLVHALQVQPYTPESLAALQQQGKPVALHFHAGWCGTCTEQERVLNQLKASNALPALTLLVVDYDANKPLRKQLKVTSQSTFIVYKGRSEVARNGGETRPEAIRALLSKAL